MDGPRIHTAVDTGAAPSGGIVGSSLIIRQLNDRVSCLAASDAPVLVTGERGSGKKLVARELHIRGAHRHEPLVILPPEAQRVVQRGTELDEAQARSLAAQWVRNAGEGTLVLEAVDELSPRAQMLIARLLRETVVDRTRANVASPRLVTLARTLAAAPHALHVQVPALRDREGDIHPLVRHFLGYYAAAARRPMPTLTPRAWRVLMYHPFPGNVRELAWAMEQALLRSPGMESDGRDEIDAEHLPPELVRSQMSGIRRVS